MLTTSAMPPCSRRTNRRRDPAGPPARPTERRWWPSAARCARRAPWGVEEGDVGAHHGEQRGARQTRQRVAVDQGGQRDADVAGGQQQHRRPHRPGPVPAPPADRPRRSEQDDDDQQDARGDPRSRVAGSCIITAASAARTAPMTATIRFMAVDRPRASRNATSQPYSPGRSTTASTRRQGDRHRFIMPDAPDRIRP